MAFSVNFLVLLLLVGVFNAISSVAPLGKYKISDVTVSGISSGAYMAVQMHIAHSSIINGSATFAGGPYFCAEDTLVYAEERCMSTTLGTPQVTKLVYLTRQDALLELIDHPKNLKDDRIYLFSGLLDTVVTQPVVHSLQQYYQHFVDATNIVADYNIEAEHCIPTLNYGESCGTLSSPYIGNCNFDGAGAALQTLYGGQLIPGTMVTANLHSFDQTAFITGKTTSLGDVGYVYVPSTCADGTRRCHLHISFHGCNQGIKSIGDAYAMNAGFNEWAEANAIIVLYPYVEASKELPSNPNGCWDWWGYSGKDYIYKSAVQISFVKRLIDHITSGAY